MRYRLETRDAAVGVEDGRIVAPEGRFDLSVDLGDAQLRAGLINAHDHLHRNHYPRFGTPRYEDAYAWGRDLHARHAAGIARARALPRRDALLFGALKNLVGGVTHVLHHDAWEPDFERDFPLSVVRVRCVHSTGFDARGVAAAAAQARSGHVATPLTIHVAEGVNAAAAEEVRTLDDAGLLDSALLAVHAIGVDDDGVARLHRAGAATVWCPTSNLFLYGRTAPAALLAGGDVLLGTDALLSGAGTLLDELRAARSLALVDDDRLADAVGRVAARRLGIGGYGRGGNGMVPGAPADIVALRRPLLESAAQHVALVVCGGVPRIGDAELAPLFEVAGVDSGELCVGGTPRRVARPLDAVARRVLDEWPECGRILAATG
ncbi:MAG TPA: hypothetical protein VK928_12140 [Longimicrobiales bacterium]|nr:hypothetical protein [Longimicrobiales bacterium]